MFIRSTDLVSIRIYYKKINEKAHKYIAFNSEDLKEEAKKSGGFSILNVKMAELNWGIYNDLQDEATIDVHLPNGETESKFSYKKFKESKLKRLLKSWDATIEVDGEVAPMPVTEENILDLAPPIAEAILSAYEDASYLTGESEKN